ncbi:MAG TPA: phosphodiesterase [Propionibacterium sp.]|nr:phosphodiesterase [Propionibacterium sp.]
MNGWSIGGADAAQRSALRTDLESCGYFPALVEDAVLLAVGEEEVLTFVVHHEPTFNRDEIRRHLTILVLTPTRLIVGHTDEQPSEGTHGMTSAATSTESINLEAINTVALTRVIMQPEGYRPGGDAAEAWLSVSWGAMRRIDLEPAACADPNCEADHGLTGAMVPDDLIVRMSAAADGAERVAKLVNFTTTLQRATGRGTAAIRAGH